MVRRDPVLLLQVGDVEQPLLLQLQHAPLLRVRARVRVRFSSLTRPGRTHCAAEHTAPPQSERREVARGDGAGCHWGC